MDSNKIFELRAETRTERSLGCHMTIANEKIGCSAKPAARRGPQPVKYFIFEAIKKEIIEKNASKLNESQEGSTRVLPKCFFGHQGEPFGGCCPPKENHFYSQ